MMLKWLARKMVDIAYRREKKQSVQRAGNGVVVTQVGLSKGEAPDKTSRVRAQEGYGENTIVFRCVKIVAEAAARIPLVVKVNDVEVSPDHYVAKILSSPNPTESIDELLTKLYSFDLIVGTAFMEGNTAVSSITGKAAAQLWVWQPYDFKVLDNPSSFVPRGYIFDNGIPSDKRTWSVDPITGFSNILSIKHFNPLSKHMGMSPLVAAALSVDQHNKSARWNDRLLDNNCVPSGALTAEQHLTDPQYQQLREQLDEVYAGAENARRPMILGGIKWEQFSMSMQELDWLAGRRMTGQEIAAAYGVPSQVIPIEGSQTFANYEEARLALYEDTVIPYALARIKSFTKWLRLLLNDNTFTIELKLDQLPALASRRANTWSTAQSSSFITINEKRALVGMEPRDEEEADVIFVPAGLLPLDYEPEDTSDTDPATDPGEEEDDEDTDEDEEDAKALTRLLKKVGFNGRSKRIAKKVLKR